MARKKNAKVYKFPGPWRNLYTLIDNLNSPGDGTGYLLITIPPERDALPQYDHNFHDSDRKYRKFVAEFLESIAEEILEDA